jgi:hypothetical protein
MMGKGVERTRADKGGRVEPYGADYEFVGLSVYGFGGVVCGEEGY